MEVENQIVLSDIADDCLFRILSNLNFQELLILRKVNKRFYKFINQNEFWKIYYYYNKNCFQVNYKNLSSLEVLNYYNLLDIMLNNYTREIRLESLCSSTQDNQQNIFETLNDEQSLFWSSTGTAGVDDRDEFLIYKVDGGQGFISSFSIKFFYAHYLQTKLYPARRVKFEAGFSSQQLTYSEDFNCNLEYQQGVEDYDVTFRLKKPVLAQVVKITLSGRVGLQETDNQYYIAVERFRIFGVHICNFDQKEDLCDLKEYIQQQIKEKENNKDENSKEELFQQLQKKICKLTKYLAQLVSKSQQIEYNNLYNKKIAQEQESKLFLETQNLNLFNQIPELRANLVAYEFIMKDPLLMKKYLETCVSVIHQLSELESLVIIIQKINFSLLGKAVAVMLELYREFDAIGDETKIENFAKKFFQFITFTVKFNQLPYEQILQQVEYFSNSSFYNYILIQKLTEFIDIPQEIYEQVIEETNFNRNNKKSKSLQYISKRQMLQYVQNKLIPIYFFILLKILLKSNQTIITTKKGVFNQVLEEKEIISLPKSQNEMVTEQRETNPKKIIRLMLEKNINSENEAKKLDEQMKKEAQTIFMDSKCVDLINQQPSLRHNYYIFETLINKPDQLNQYIHSRFNDKQNELNGFESICFFIPYINYKLIIKILDLAFDLANQSQQQKISAQELKNDKKNICHLIQLFFQDNLKLKSIENQDKYKQFKFSKSTSAYYLFIKPLQNYLKISDEDVEKIADSLKQNLSTGLKVDQKTLSFNEYKTFVEQHLLGQQTIQIFKHLMENYEIIPSFISDLQI
ncbi:F-box protein (macronuclear) [Tetrahymena thermophila SB210]|uniref:F-box protein n=1 Tax=Tetrahymena thermophila (strain SB210) TaxID=312017 RepID=I7MHX4_TETTS|nr:F-box protein [Tetrahymena thermophila SB210]EAS03707.2 F-box protein [Tetrahymena thermophila SB210]|eukprot:XP_001023952.2 F-box protein [Tetrahymena thermophila SB210]